MSKYNYGKGAVDAVDGMRAATSPDRRSAKWTMRVFEWFIDSIAINAYVCERAVGGDNFRKSHDAWIVETINAIFKRHAPETYRRRHVKHICVHAKMENNLSDTGVCARCQKITQTYCMGCMKYYCVMARSCFKEAHVDV